MSIRTLLIGLDGCTFSVLDPLFEAGEMPFLRSFFDSGVRAPLRTIVPPLTPPAWTSLMTGRTPGQHGVFDFFRRDSLDDHHIRFFTSQDVQCETIWSLASRSGLRVTVLNFPATFPAPKLNGFVVPGWVPWRQLRLACWPSDLFDSLKESPGFNPRELAMDIKLEERATEGCADHREFEPWIELHIRREKNWLEVTKRLTMERASDLTAVLFDGVDKLQHLCWRFLRPEDAVPLRHDWEFRIRELCLDYFRYLDHILGELCELAGNRANVLLASDHGFGPTWEIFHINAWLASKGYLSWSEAGQNNGYQPAALGVGQVARHTWTIDWSRTKAFAATPTSNGIFIVTSEDGKKGVRPAEYEAFRLQLVNDLREVVDPDTAERIVTGVWTRDEVFRGPHEKYSPDLTIALRDGGLVSILPSSNGFLRRREEIAGTHRPVGIFGARGPAFHAGVEIEEELSILDVAPVVLHLLGLPVPSGMQGRIPTNALDSDWLDLHPPCFSSYDGERIEPCVPDLAPSVKTTIDDETVVLERLRDLGYVE